MHRHILNFDEFTLQTCRIHLTLQGDNFVLFPWYIRPVNIPSYQCTQLMFHISAFVFSVMFSLIFKTELDLFWKYVKGKSLNIWNIKYFSFLSFVVVIKFCLLCFQFPSLACIYYVVQVGTFLQIYKIELHVYSTMKSWITCISFCDINI